MAAELSSLEIERFRAAIARRLGLWFDEGRTGFLDALLRQRANNVGDEAQGYVERLEGMGLETSEMRALAQALTVPETYFFRNEEQLAALVDVAIPACLETRAEERSLRFLSAGCASGEEAYSIAMLLLERFSALSDWRFSIDGIDINPAVLERARAGEYSPWSLRSTSPERRGQYFRTAGNNFVLTDRVRSQVRFHERNLVESDARFWGSDAFDIVFCRNVTMYFPPEIARAVIGRIAGSLSPGGFLFLGHAETLRDRSDAFQLCHTHQSFYYRLRDEAQPPHAFPVFEALPPPEVRWNLDIEQSAARVEALLAEKREAELDEPPKSSEKAPAPGLLEEILGWMARERYSDALSLLEKLPKAAHADPHVRLLEAILLAHSGRSPEAEERCALLFAVEDVSAMAHHLTAISRAQSGDWPGAVGHDEAASRLDPSFALPHLHLGRLARRARDLHGARKQLTRALALLPNEEPSRILFFGGGFSRETLAEVCQQELRSLGGEVS